MNVIKRDGREDKFQKGKITLAIQKASDEVEKSGGEAMPQIAIQTIATEVYNNFKAQDCAVSVENIQDAIESLLMQRGYYDVAKTYIRYRYERQLARNGNTTDGKILSIVDGVNEDVIQENSNKNPKIAATQRDYIAGEVSRDIVNRLILPKDIREAHEQGLIHFHDSDYAIQRTHNCCLINLEDMLQNGTVINGTLIEKPHSFATACNIATQVMAQVASNQYGGQSESLAHLVPFIDVSRKKIRKQVMEEVALLNSNATDEQINEITEGRLKEEIKRGVQTIQYQINTLMTTNGQTPFVSIFLYLNEVRDGREKDDFAMLIEEVLKQRIEGTKNEQGVWITPAFPKILYVLEEDNVHKGDKYYYLTELAAKCTAKRMVPDYISEKKMLEYKGNCFPCMGCRSFLTPDRTTENLANANNWIKGKKYYGRFNQGVVTINLADVGLSANKDFDKFWKIFDERLELCHRALQIRHNRLLGTLSDVSPIHWQHGGLARLKKGEKIDKLLYDGYSTISLGYAGLYECVLSMTGKSHTSDEAKPFALEIMQHMNDKCNEWKASENIDYSLYGSPIESTTYKFAKCLKKRFGVIPGITDRNYITNSYHVVVTEKIDAFNKLKFESEFQRLSPGGAISYVEIPNLTDNVEAVLSVIKFIYDNIMYAELNTKCDYCQVCGYDGEIQIVKDDDGKLVWECPNCKNRDKSKMNIVRRTCGYLGTNDWNQGRTQEIKERVVHLGVQ
jgi:ribonucleoside-triphosphate reductase (formate)